MRTYRIPGARDLQIAHVVLDLNGTLSDRGELMFGVADQLAELARDLELHLATADTLGTADRLATALPVTVHRISAGSDKANLVERLGAKHTAVIGNGANDAAMLEAAALGIAVIGPEGAAGTALLAADLICRSIGEALALLASEPTLASTIRP